MKLEELQTLRKELTRHDYRYYILNQPTISDQAYDMLYKKYEMALVEVVGQDTHSLELQDEYPQWIQWEFQGYKPVT